MTDAGLRFFLFGPLAQPEVTGALCGAEQPGRAALWPDRAEGATARYGLASVGPGDGIAGVLVTLGADPAARLVFLAQGLGLETVVAQVTCGGDTVTAQTFVAPGRADRPWDKTAWQDRWAPLMPHVLREAREHLGRFEAPTLARMMPMIMARAEARHIASTGKPTDHRSDMGADQIEIARQSVPHAGYFLTRSYDLRHPGFAGGQSPVVRREVFVATDAAIVLPYDPQRDRVLLVEQFRMGPFGRGDPNPWMLEPVAGRVDPGETPESCARRECEEEAGLRLTGLEHISSHYCSPGCSSEYFHLYLGLCDLPDLNRGRGGLETENEDIRTHVLSFEAAFGLLASGEADNGPLVLSIIWLKSARNRLRRGA